MGTFKARLFGSVLSAAMLSAGLLTLAAAPAHAIATCTNAVSVTADSSGDTHAVVPGASNGVSWNPGECQLSQGNSGAGVKAMQRGLNACYSAGLTVDGQFGPNTRSALIAVQKRIGVTADGIFGPQTRGTMYWMVYNDDRPLGCRYVRYA